MKGLRGSDATTPQVMRGQAGCMQLRLRQTATLLTERTQRENAGVSRHRRQDGHWPQ